MTFKAHVVVKGDGSRHAAPAIVLSLRWFLQSLHVSFDGGDRGTEIVQCEIRVCC